MAASASGQKEPKTLDALVIGAGFSGTYLLHKLRSIGLKVKLVDRASSYGGVWRQHQYPGARVDSPVPLYEFSAPELWTEWTWSERFPASPEIGRYFGFVADKWKLRDDTIFNQAVESAKWDEDERLWTVKSKSQTEWKARFLLPCVGHTSRSYMPQWKGAEKFKGLLLHSSDWPKLHPEIEGKKVAVIGTGATGMQLVQELSKVATRLAVFHRRLNFGNPMRQEHYAPGERALPPSETSRIFAERVKSFAGVDFNFQYERTFDHTPEQRQETYRRNWEAGDYRAWTGSYADMLFDKAANYELYKFWRDKTRAKINDERVKDLLAPMTIDEPYGCKHIALEDGFYECFNLSNVHLVDANTTPIEALTENGIKTTDEEIDFDVIVCATGYDNFTGGLLDLNICDAYGRTIKEKWDNHDRTLTNLGLSTNGYPNLFFPYSVQAPTPFCNAPSCVEIQGNWLTDLLHHMKDNALTRIETSAESERVWADQCTTIAEHSLLSQVDSYYWGRNIPGKRREMLAYLGGVPTYVKTLEECREKGYEGFVLE